MEVGFILIFFEAVWRNSYEENTSFSLWLES